jgi:hypothetical protein
MHVSVVLDVGWFAPKTSSQNKKPLPAGIVTTMLFTIMNHDGSNAAYASNLPEEVGPYDVLCGRSAFALNNVGNRRFRVTVSMALHRYLSTPTRTGKTKVIDSIVASVKSSGGRFLKWRNSQWIELDGKQAREKVGHALRDMSSTWDADQPQSHPKSQPTTLLNNLPTKPLAQPSHSRDASVRSGKRSGPVADSRQRGSNDQFAKTQEKRFKEAIASSLSLSSSSSSSSSSSASTMSSSTTDPIHLGSSSPKDCDWWGDDHFTDDYEVSFEFDLDLEPLSSMENSASAINGEDIPCLLKLLEKSEL